MKHSSKSANPEIVLVQSLDNVDDPHNNQNPGDYTNQDHHQGISDYLSILNGQHKIPFYLGTSFLVFWFTEYLLILPSSILSQLMLLTLPYVKTMIHIGQMHIYSIGSKGEFSIKIKMSCHDVLVVCADD